MEVCLAHPFPGRVALWLLSHWTVVHRFFGVHACVDCVGDVKSRCQSVWTRVTPAISFFSPNVFLFFQTHKYSEMPDFEIRKA